MSISKRTIKARTTQKTNSELVDTIHAARKNSVWVEKGIARYLSGSTRVMPEVNLNMLEKNCEAGDIAIVPGKILGTGSINKKIKVCAFKFSKQAMEKLKAKKCETGSIMDEIKNNPKATGVKIII
ncbi:MAG: 50S ribosomal protein L18e [Nanoarchaeota archaeon]